MFWASNNYQGTCSHCGWQTKETTALPLRPVFCFRPKCGGRILFEFIGTTIVRDPQTEYVNDWGVGSGNGRAKTGRPPKSIPRCGSCGVAIDRMHKSDCGMNELESIHDTLSKLVTEGIPA